MNGTPKTVGPPELVPTPAAPETREPLTGSVPDASASNGGDGSHAPVPEPCPVRRLPPPTPMPDHEPGYVDPKLEELGEIFLNLGEKLSEFRRKHPAWPGGEVPADEPVYRIPTDVVDHLADPERLTKKPGLRPVFTPQQADAERAFTLLCASFGPDVVGVWRGRQVHYGLLTDPPPPVTAEQIAEGGWTRSDLDAVVAQSLRGMGLEPPAPTSGGPLTTTRIQADLATTTVRADTYRQEQLGWVGWLLFSDRSMFRTEVAALRSADRGAGGVFQFPFRPAAMHASLPVVTGPSAAPLPGTHTAVLETAVRLVWNHQLAGLATWDLPEPQGVLEAVPLGVASRFLNPEQRVLVVPPYARRPGAEHLAEFIRRLQRTNARDCGLPDKPPKAAHADRECGPNTFARAFEFWFVENAVRSRFPGGGPRGLVARLREWFGVTNGLSDERVSEVRKVYRDVFEG